jgi:hypothetical protein
MLPILPAPSDKLRAACAQVTGRRSVARRDGQVGGHHTLGGFLVDRGWATVISMDTMGKLATVPVTTLVSLAPEDLHRGTWMTRRPVWTALLCCGLLGLLGGCSAAAPRSPIAAPSDVATPSAGTAGAAGSRLESARTAKLPPVASATPTSATPASPTRPVRSFSAACSSRVLLPWLRARVDARSAGHDIAGVKIERCRNGFAHVFAIPRTPAAGEGALEGEQFFLAYRNGSWRSVSQGTGISCADPDAGSYLVRACAALGYPTSPQPGRISDPQVAADRLVQAWVRHDSAAAGRLVRDASTIEALFSERAPATAPLATPCRPAGGGLFVCSYPLSAQAELSVMVGGGASAGYTVTGVEWGD